MLSVPGVCQAETLKMGFPPIPFTDGQNCLEVGVNMKKYIPNTITLLNLFCGCGAIVAVLNAQYVYVFWLISIGLVADVFDGAAARWLGVSSPMGKELDSLADMVSFGVLPAATLYALLSENEGAGGGELEFWYLPAFIIAIFAGLRLAKFNLDVRQSENFLGLPTPSTTMVVMGLLWIAHFERPELLYAIVTHPLTLWLSVFLLSFLMIAEIPFFSLKIKAFTWKGNELRFIFAAITVVLLIVMGVSALILIMLTYILLNLIAFLFSKVKGARH